MKKLLKESIKEAYRILTLRILFPVYYLIYSRKEIKKKKIVFVESQNAKLSNSMQVLYDAIRKDSSWDSSIHCLREAFVSKAVFIKAALNCLKDMADAEAVILCEASRLVSCIPKRKGTTVVQLWHGCGAFKKFGLSSSDMLFGGLRRNHEKYPYYKNLDYVTVSSPEVVWAYEEAMNIPKGNGVVVPVGISRTDLFFQEDFRKEAREKAEELVPACKDKKVILYAPTFRGNVNQAAAPDQLDIQRMCEALSDQYILVIMHHPYVRKRPEIPEEAKAFAFDLTGKIGIESMICISDICISDYSSLIFEYSLFEKPMIFFAYDLEEYGDWRGFYYNYDEMTPGPVYRTTEEIICYIEKIESEFQPEIIQAFREKFMSACDGQATDRILQLLERRG